jgi:hypothetical protein
MLGSNYTFMQITRVGLSVARIVLARHRFG